MSAIFISHSSRNKDLAVEIYRRLQESDYKSVFLDVHRQDGIIAGEKWEQVLYRELRTCQVFLGLITDEWEASRWCFAEFSHAREKGKTIIGLELSPGAARSILGDTQIIPFGKDVREEGCEHLWAALRQALDIRGFYKWDPKDPKQSPYPGLGALDEQHAAVFFGRDSTVYELRDRLSAIRQDPSEEKRLVLVMGASGSGKSSLVRAGLVPLLKHHDDKRNWVVFSPFRPGSFPLNELAKAYALILYARNESADWRGVRQLFEQSVTSANSAPLTDLNETVRMRLGRPEATLLIVIDQLEESLKPKGSEQNDQFLILLRMLASIQGRAMLLLGTLRSDFVGEFQRDERTRQIPYHLFPINSSDLDFRAVVAGPAAAAQIELQEGVVDEIVNDTQTPDALPLLALTLHELWRQFGSDKQLTRDEYRVLGGLEGSLDRIAEDVCKQFSLTAESSEELRQAFLRLVRVEGGRYVRKAAPWEELPVAVHTVLEGFVQRGLLVSRIGTTDPERVVEVAHDAVFRRWERLVSWLSEEQPFLVWREELNRELKRWDRANRHKSALLRGISLPTAKNWLKQRSGQLDPSERVFIQTSISAAFWQRALWGAVTVAAIGLLGSLQFKATLESRRADVQSEIALARQLETSAESIEQQSPALLEMGALLAVESMRRVPSAEAYQIMITDFPLLTQPLATLRHEKQLLDVAFSPNGKYIATTSDDETARLWEVGTWQEIARLKHGGGVYRSVFSPDSGFLATSADDKQLHIWAVPNGNEVAKFDLELNGGDIAFSSNGEYLATGTWGLNLILPEKVKYARIWEVNTWHELRTIPLPGSVNAIRFISSGEHVVTATDDRAIRVFETKGGNEEVSRTAGQVGDWRGLAISPDEQSFAFGGGSGAQIWTRSTGEVKPLGHKGRVNVVAFSPIGRSVATAGVDNTVKIWDTATAMEARRVSHAGNIEAVSYSPDGKLLATGAGDSTARLWDPFAGRELARMIHGDTVVNLAYSPNGNYLATASEDKTAKVWNTHALWQPHKMVHNAPVTDIVFSPDGDRMGVITTEKTIYLWDFNTGDKILLPGASQEINRVVFSSHGRYLATFGENRTVTVWEVDKARTALTIPNSSTIAFSPDEKLVATGSGDVDFFDIQAMERAAGVPESEDPKRSRGEAQLWEIEAGIKLATMSHLDPVASLQFSRDGARLATSCNPAYLIGPDRPTKVFLWDISQPDKSVSVSHEELGEGIVLSKDGTLFAALHGSEAVVRNLRSGSEVLHVKSSEDVRIGGAAFSQNGRYMAFYTSDNTVRVREISTGNEIARVPNIKQVIGVDFSSDGKYLITENIDKTRRVLESQTGQEIIRMDMEDKPVVFSPEGKYVALAEGNTVTVMPWRPDEIISETCNHLSRNLTYQEWLQYLGEKPYEKTCANLKSHASVREAGQDLAKNNHIDRAITLLDRVNELDPELMIQPKTEAYSFLAIGRLHGLTDSETELVNKEKLKEAIELAHEIAPPYVQSVSTKTWNSLCWEGSVAGYGKQVLQACENAVQMGSKTQEDWFYKDSRGLARALTGSVEGAIADFQSFIQRTSNAEQKSQRQRWVDALRAGEDPFTSEELATLRDQ